MPVSRIAALVVLSTLASAGEPEGGVELPRYRFAVGEELVYETTDVARVALFRFPSTETNAVCPLRRLADGRWSLLVRTTLRIQDQTVRMVARVELHPDGSALACRPDGIANGMGIWHPLPATPAMLRDGWAGKIGDDEARYSFEGRDKDLWRFRLGFGSARSDYTVDGRLGRPVRIEYEAHDGAETRTRSTRFRELVHRGADWAAKAERESDDYLDTRERHGFRYRGARATLLEQAYKDAHGALDALRKRTSLPEIRDVVDADLAEMERIVDARRKNARELATRLDKPAPAWKLRDLDGVEHSLRQYRGKVVILEFWESGCGFCLDAMPLVNVLAQRLRGRPVTILGMNVSDDEDDAREVVSKLRVSYPTLLGAGRVQGDYDATGIPLLVVIDRDGIVRDFYSGYSPTLTDDLLPVVERLLK